MTFVLCLLGCEVFRFSFGRDLEDEYVNTNEELPFGFMPAEDNEE